MALNKGIERNKAQLEVLSIHPDAGELLTRCAYPVFIFSGCNEVLRPHLEQQRINNVATNIELVLIEDAEHFVMLEQITIVNLHLYNYFGGAVYA